jgi:hypothetical protein
MKDKAPKISSRKKPHLSDEAHTDFPLPSNAFASHSPQHMAWSESSTHGLVPDNGGLLLSSNYNIGEEKKSKDQLFSVTLFH